MRGVGDAGKNIARAVGVPEDRNFGVMVKD
jgi:hypothetical protein